ncbi:MAG: CDP-alcohol phosphatidyltransferase family protein [Nitrospirae bacterium]|nr:MAG: CDP-alcohol phosphatidyltransferase family protein [Nitrospirota bacterium]
MDRTLHEPATKTIDTAIVLTSSGLFALTTETRPDASQAHGDAQCVAGLSPFQRTLLTLQRGGISQIWVLAGPEERALRAILQRDHRIHAAVRWLPIREFPPAQAETWETLAEEIKGSCVVMSCHAVCSPSLIHRLRKEGADGRVLVVVGYVGHGGYPDNPRVNITAEEIRHLRHIPQIVFHDRSSASQDQPIANEEEPRLVAGDVVVLPARLFGVSGMLRAHGSNPLRLALEQAAVEGVLQPIDGEPHQYCDIRCPDGPRLAESKLLRSLQSLKGGLDGFIDTHLNRKFSGILTRWFLQAGWSPNAITILSMLLGLVSAGCFAVGSYALGVLGALLLQLAVIIDCCDGEVARLTYSETKFGQELDIWADNVVHIAVFAGIAWGAYRYGPWAGSQIPLILGAVTVMANVLSFLFVNYARSLRSRPHVLRRLGVQTRDRIEFMLSRVANRDFSIVVMVFACLDMLSWFLWLAAPGSLFFAATMGWLLRGAIRLRA